MSIDENQQDEQEMDLAQQLENNIDESQNDVTEEVAPEPEIEALQPLEAWQDDWKTNFNNLNEFEKGRDVQQTWLDQYKSMQGDYTRKTQTLADERKQYEREMNDYHAYQQAIQPMQQAWQMNGINPAMGVSQLVAYGQALQQNPQDTILQLAKQYNVDLEKTISEQPYQDPEIRTLQEQNQQMQNQLMQFQNQYQQGQQAQSQDVITTQIQQFRDAVDSSGKPVNQFFDAVHEDMATLISMGKAKSLDDAYKMATQYNPEVQKQIQEKTKQEELAKQQADVKKAKNATTRIASKSKETPVPDMSLREQLLANWSEAG